MFIENEDNIPLINLDHISHFYRGHDTYYIIKFILKVSVDAEGSDQNDYLIWQFDLQFHRDKTFDSITENLINKRGYAKV